MDYTLNEDQTALVSAVQAILEDYHEIPQIARRQPCYFNMELQTRITENGFLDCAREYSPLEAALVSIEIAKLPCVIEAASSSLVVPMVCGEVKVEGPVALIEFERLDKAHRNLSVARHVLVNRGDSAVLLPVHDGMVEPVDTIYGYPYGRFLATPELENGLVFQNAPLIHWWRVALAAEMTGAARAAIDFTVDYVKQRKVFGKPIGAFQAIHHRLAQCHQLAQGMHYMTVKAAWSGDPAEASMAACYCQQQAQKILFDVHQFNGAMGVTFEHLLHFWTYRLRALQSEAGGVHQAAMNISDLRWGVA
jgi:hypothetical protein